MTIQCFSYQSDLFSRTSQKKSNNIMMTDWSKIINDEENK